MCQAALAGVMLLAAMLLIAPDRAVAERGISLVLSFAKPPSVGPAPLIGVGLPAMTGVLAVLEFARRFRQKK